VFALEIASHTTYKRDLRAKPARFAELGVAEYWRLDPTGGALYGAPLAGDRLEGGVYQPITLHRLEKGNVWGRSEATGIDLLWMNGSFVYLGPDSGR